MALDEGFGGRVDRTLHAGDGDHHRGCGLYRIFDRGVDRTFRLVAEPAVAIGAARPFGCINNLLRGLADVFHAKVLEGNGAQDTENSKEDMHLRRTD